MLIKIRVAYDDGGNAIEAEVPGRFEVCPRCQGRGRHVNPAIESHGITQEDFDADPDFMKGYFSGRYDIDCERCDGKRVIAVADVAACTPAQQRLIIDAQRLDDEEARDRAEWAAEMRFCGYC
jgi:hypothetical protein